MKARAILPLVLSLTALSAQSCTPATQNPEQTVPAETPATYIPAPPTGETRRLEPSCSPGITDIVTEPPLDLRWDPDGRLLYATYAAEGRGSWWQFDPSNQSLARADLPGQALPEPLADMVPQEDRYTHVTLSPSGTKALYYIERFPPTPSVPAIGEGYLGPIVNDIYVANATVRDVLYAGQILDHIDQVLWYPDDVTVLATTTDLGPTTTRTWQFEAAALPRIVAFAPPDAYPYSFSPDGTFLLFSDGTKLWVRNLSSMADVPLPFSAHPGEVWWSPDSSTLAALVSDDSSISHIDLFNVESLELTRLAPALTDLAHWYTPRAAISPDFTLLAYLAADTPFGAGSRLSLARLCPIQSPTGPLP